MALTHRLYELGLLTDWGYRSICVQLSRLAYRRSEPDGIPRESSQLLSKAFRSIRDEGDTPATIAAAIGITSDELQQHVFGLTLTTLPGAHHCSAKPARSGLHLVPPIGRGSAPVTLTPRRSPAQSSQLSLISGSRRQPRGSGSPISDSQGMLPCIPTDTARPTTIRMMARIT